jgi:hypothetical protein
MKRFIIVASLCILASSVMAVAHPASADIRVNANLSTGHVYFDTQPNVVLVPNTQVYYAPYGNYEVYRYHSHWYANRNGTWFRSSSYRGPYYQTDMDRVPQQVVSVPMDYRQQFNDRHHSGWRRSHREWDNDNNNNNNNNDNDHH